MAEDYQHTTRLLSSIQVDSTVALLKVDAPPQLAKLVGLGGPVGPLGRVQRLSRRRFEEYVILISYLP